MDSARQALILKLCGLAHKNIPPDQRYGFNRKDFEDQVAMHQLRLSSFSGDQLTRAYDRWCDENKTFPHHSDIRKLINKAAPVSRPELQILPAPEYREPTAKERAYGLKMIAEMRANFKGGSVECAVRV